MRAACGGGAVCGFLFDPSAPLRSAHATLPRLPFPGLLRNGPPMARLWRLRPAFFCRRQRQGAIPFIQREAFGEGHTLEGHRRPSPAGRNQDFSARRKNGSPPGGLPFLFFCFAAACTWKNSLLSLQACERPPQASALQQTANLVQKAAPLEDQNSALPVVRGCSSTSRMLLTPVRYMTMRSKPRP